MFEPFLYEPEPGCGSGRRFRGAWRRIFASLAGGGGGGDDDGWPRSPVWVEWYCGVVALWLVLRNITERKEVVEK